MKTFSVVLDPRFAFALLNLRRFTMCTLCSNEKPAGHEVAPSLGWQLTSSGREAQRWCTTNRSNVTQAWVYLLPVFVLILEILTYLVGRSGRVFCAWYRLFLSLVPHKVVINVSFNVFFLSLSFRFNAKREREMRN